MTRLAVLLLLLLSGCAAFSSDCAERYVCPTLSIGIEIPLSRTRDLPPPERYEDDSEEWE